LYLYPDFEVIKKIANVMITDKRICRYIDIPFQHVSDRVLKSMRRGYGKKEIMAIIAYLRDKVPGITIRSAFITGFPGETKEDFEELREFIKLGLIDKAGFFQYSDEPGTHAYTLPDKGSKSVAGKRRDILMLDSAKNYHYNNEAKYGKTLETLIIGADAGGHFMGRTQDNAPDIDSYVGVKSAKRLVTGKFYKVLITGVKNSDLMGEVK
jgi:ribosomal protein S12 methylthiotransferase